MLLLSLLPLALTTNLYFRGWFYRPIPFSTLESTLRSWRESENDHTYYDMLGWHLTCTNRHASLALYDGHEIKAIAQYFEKSEGNYAIRAITASPEDFTGVNIIVSASISQNISIEWESLRCNEKTFLEVTYGLKDEETDEDTT
jgi:hypothetical protein